MADLQAILRDPDFLASSVETKRAILRANDRDFAQSAKATQDEIIRSVHTPSLGESVVRSIAPFVLGTIGSVAGAAAGTAAGGPVGTIPGAILGGGIGAIGGEGINQLIAPTLDPKTDVLREGAYGMLGEGVGRGLAAAGGVLLRGLKILPSEDAPRVLGAMDATGVTPKVTDVAGTRLPGTIEAGLTQMWTGQGPIRAAAERQARQLTSAAEDFLAIVGPESGRSGVATGEKVSASIARNVERSRGRENALFQNVAQLANDIPVDISELKSVATRLVEEESLRLPGQRNTVLIRQATAIFKAPDLVPWRLAREWQKGFGEAVERGELISRVPTGQAKLLFGTISSDMERAVVASGRTEVVAAFREARDFARQRRELFRDSAVANVMETDPEKVIKTIDAAGGPTAIRRAREAIIGLEHAPDPRAAEAWNAVRRHIFEGVFREARDTNAKGFVSEVISGARLERQLKRLGDEALGELLAPTERRALENIQTVATAIRRGERTGAVPMTSSTGQALGIQGTIAGVGAAFGGIGAAISVLLTPPVLAKLLTSPRAAEVLASPGFARVAQDLRLGGQLSKEGTIALSRLGALLFGEQRSSGSVTVGAEAQEAAR